MIISIIWVIVYFSKHKWVPDLKRNIAISFISILFILHPTLAQNSLSIFQWVEIDDDVSKVRIFTDMDWLNNEHLSWCFIIGLPILAIWVTFTPIFALILLAKNINKNEDNRIKQYMLILYQGLKPNRYYWEFVNTLRKVLILMSFALLVVVSLAYKILISLMILLFTFRIQVRLKPYKNDNYNNIEILAIFAGSITLFSGLIFINDEGNQTILNTLVLWFLIVFNIVFLARWAYLYVLCMSEKNKVFERILIIFKIMMCQKKIFGKLKNLSISHLTYYYRRQA